MAARLRAARERVARRLERELGLGRLTTDEYADRIAAAYRARTLGELVPLTSDLPSPEPQAPTAGRPIALMALGSAALAAALLLVIAVVSAGAPAAAIAEMVSQMGAACH